MITTTAASRKRHPYARPSHSRLRRSYALLRRSQKKKRGIKAADKKRGQRKDWVWSEARGWIDAARHPGVQKVPKPYDYPDNELYPYPYTFCDPPPNPGPRLWPRPLHPTPRFSRYEGDIWD